MNTLGKWFHERLWAGLLIVGIIAGLVPNTGCIIQMGPPPPPPGATAPTTTTTTTTGTVTEPTTTTVNQTLQVAITQATTAVVSGYVTVPTTSVVTSAPVVVYLLAVLPAESTGTTTYANPVPLLSATASSTTTVVGSLTGSLGFVFNLSQVSSSRASEITTGKQVVVQATQYGAVPGMSSVATLQ